MTRGTKPFGSLLHLEEEKTLVTLEEVVILLLKTIRQLTIEFPNNSLILDSSSIH